MSVAVPVPTLGWDFETFVLAHVPSGPTRILEVGCGEGDLARGLAAAGHSVTAIDPEAPQGPLVRRVTLEEFAEPGPFHAGGEDAPGSLDECVVEWERDDAHIHGYGEMLGALDRRFQERFFAWVPYLFRDLEGGASEADEQAAVEAGTIEATGFRYVGAAPIGS